jgi:hypothetical protein
MGKPTSFFTKDLIADDEEENEEVQKALEGRTDIGATQKQQLIQSRRGQGIFKVNVRLNETKCRLTGVKDIRMLIASHIKPWAKSSACRCRAPRQIKRHFSKPATASG